MNIVTSVINAKRILSVYDLTYAFAKQTRKKIRFARIRMLTSESVILGLLAQLVRALLWYHRV